MEALGLVILSAFAFYGIFLTISGFLRRLRPKKYDAGYKMILSVPEKAAENLEGIVRGIFSEEIPEKLMTNNKLYVMIPDMDPQIGKVISDLQKAYPVEVLPQTSGYCMITDRKPNP